MLETSQAGDSNSDGKEGQRLVCGEVLLLPASNHEQKLHLFSYIVRQQWRALIVPSWSDVTRGALVHYSNRQLA